MTDILATVLKSEPDWAALPADVPASIRTLVKRCLEKDRTRRVTDIGAALFVIDEQASLAPGATAALPVRMPPLWKRGYRCGSRRRRGGDRQRRLVEHSIVRTAAHHHSIPASRCPRAKHSLQSPSRRMARRWSTRPTTGAVLRSMSELEARPIQGAEALQSSLGSLNAVFSPDGQSIAFWEQTGRSSELPSAAEPRSRSVRPTPCGDELGQRRDRAWPERQRHHAGVREWRYTGSARQRERQRADASSPDAARRTDRAFTLATGLSAPAWDKAHIVVQSLRSGERKTLIEGGSDARYPPTGHLVYALGGTLFAVLLDLRRLEVTGGLVPIVEGVRRGITFTGGAALFSVSNTGSWYTSSVPQPVECLTGVCAGRSSRRHRALETAAGAYLQFARLARRHAPRLRHR